MNSSIARTLFIILLPSVSVLGGCEQAPAPGGARQGNRVTLEMNEHSKSFGEYTVLVNAITTDQLPAEVAGAYRISRSKNKALLNVSIQKITASGTAPVAAGVSVTVKNLNNQLKAFDVREIRDSQPEAIYYIGQVSVNHEETLIFDVDVVPEGTSTPILLSYRQRFFTL